MSRDDYVTYIQSRCSVYKGVLLTYIFVKYYMYNRNVCLCVHFSTIRVSYLKYKHNSFDDL